MLAASEGAVIEANASELAVAAAAPSNTSWLGCIFANNTIMAGAVVGRVEGLPSPEACCRACRADAGCDVWTFCGQPGGCSFVREPRRVELQEGECEWGRRGALASDVWLLSPPLAAACSCLPVCPNPPPALPLAAGELRFNSIATAAGGWPPNVLAKNAGAGFVGGAPLAAYTGELPGFDRLPGRHGFDVGDYSCPGSLRCGGRAVDGATPQP